jgi:hypothetical protein
LGVLFYKIFEGVYPFKVRKNCYGMWAFTNTSLEFSNKTSLKNRKLIKRMLGTKPERRISLEKILRNWEKYN